jgi:hypothetical protein
MNYQHLLYYNLEYYVILLDFKHNSNCFSFKILNLLILNYDLFFNKYHDKIVLKSLFHYLKFLKIYFYLIKIIKINFLIYYIKFLIDLINFKLNLI